MVPWSITDLTRLFPPLGRCLKLRGFSILCHPLPIVNVCYRLSAVDFGHKLDTSEIFDLSLRPRKLLMVNEKVGSGGRDRTADLGVMNPISAAAYNAFHRINSIFRGRTVV